ncbi:MAG: metallophosphoesterase family protein [Candidatus Aenigmatarchaeota archaeon]|nr:metallophosphoesterase family protein [Candidatus Aenigmarchaeota archaeon]
MVKLTKKEIVEKFLLKEKLLTPEALEVLTNLDDITKILEKLSKKDRILLTKEDITLENMQNKVKIIMNITSKPTELTPEIFTKFYASKFEKMKNIIINKFQKDFVSIENIKHRKLAYIIGRVIDIESFDNKTKIALEDFSGSKEFVFDNEAIPKDIQIDDIVLACVTSNLYSENYFIGKEILYPDVPIREPSKGYGKIAIISDLHLDEAPLERLEKFIDFFEKSDIKFLIVIGDIGKKEKFIEMFRKIRDKVIFLIPGEVDDNTYPSLPLEINGNDIIISLSNPSMIEINNIKILLIHRFDISMLKKRYLGKSRIIFEEDYLTLNEVPDIVACGYTHEPEIINYKCITIVNAGSLLADFRPVIIDLDTREYKQLRFD